MLAVKYQSKRFGEYDSEDLKNHSMALLFRIHTITGWKLPDDEFFLNALVSEFEKFLIERYSDLNPDEISYAFRNYGPGVIDWGKSMNLFLIDEPISKYLSVRKCLSDIEERKTIQETNLIAPITDDNELIETVKSVFLKTGKAGLIPTKVYDILEKSGEISLTNEQKLPIRNQVEARLNREAFEGDELLKRLTKRDYEIRVRNECKSQAAANYFNQNIQ